MLSQIRKYKLYYEAKTNICLALDHRSKPLQIYEDTPRTGYAALFAEPQGTNLKIGHTDGSWLWLFSLEEEIAVVFVEAQSLRPLVKGFFSKRIHAAQVVGEDRERWGWFDE